MPMTGNEMRQIRRNAGFTQTMLAERIGLSRKTINESEALGEGFIERRTELTIRQLTLAAQARALLIQDAKDFRADGNHENAHELEVAANLLTGNYATDERTLYNLARTAAAYRLKAERLERKATEPRIRATKD